MESLSNLSAAVMGFLVAYGYVALFLLLFAEEAGVPLPLPGDTLVMYSAYQAHHGHLNGWWVFVASVAGSYGGSMLLYFVSLKGGHRLLKKYGRYIRLDPARVDRMENRFRRWGVWAIIFARMVPGLRIATTAMAGVFAIPFRVYAPASLAGIILWATVYYILGIILGESYMYLHDALGGYFRWAVIVAIVIGVGILAAFLIRRRMRNSEHDDKEKPLVLVSDREESETP